MSFVLRHTSESGKEFTLSEKRGGKIEFMIFPTPGVAQAFLDGLYSSQLLWVRGPKKDFQDYKDKLFVNHVFEPVEYIPPC